MGLFETDKCCIDQRKYVNIPAWHNEGYLGQGLNVFCDDVGGNHTSIVVDIIQTILPKASIYTGNISYTTSGGVVSSCNINCTETKREFAI